MAWYTEPLGITFILTSIYILGCMFMALRVEKVMQSAYWLIMMLVGVGVIFLLANSEIIFAFQISIYAGGIAVLLLFAVLLTQHDDKPFPDGFGKFLQATWSQILIFAILAINLIAVLWRVATDEAYLDGKNELGDASIKSHNDPNAIENMDAFEITRQFTIDLWGTFGQVIPFLGLLLLAALMGSVKLAIREWEIEELSEEMKNNILQAEAAAK